MDDSLQTGMPRCRAGKRNPHFTQAARGRKHPVGAVALDGHAWCPLRPQDPPTQLLRLLCRDEIGLIEQRTALVQQLQQALYEYYPAAPQAFDDWTVPAAWTFVERFPTPRELVRAGRRGWQRFLHLHRLYRPATAEKRLEVFGRAAAFASPSESVTTAKSLLALTIVKQLRTWEAQLSEYRRRIEAAFGDHHDHDLFDSLPGGGKKLAPRLLGEIGGDRERFPSAAQVQSYSGIARVTVRSGTRCSTRPRRACPHFLRQTVHEFAAWPVRYCRWAGVYCDRGRAAGQLHHAALRALAFKWIRVLHDCWRNRQPYDEARSQAELLRRDPEKWKAPAATG